MQPDPAEKPPLETALDALREALEAWDPEAGTGVEPMLAQLREVQLHFDPRKARLPSALCLGSMRLLEELSRYGSVRPTAAIDVVRELSEQLRSTLESAQPTTPGSLRILPSHPSAGPAPAGGSDTGGLSLKLVDDLRLGEMMVSMSMISQADCDRVLRAQTEMRQPRKKFGELCVELGIASQETVDAALRMQRRGHAPRAAPSRGADPWGDRPL